MAVCKWADRRPRPGGLELQVGTESPVSSYLSLPSSLTYITTMMNLHSKENEAKTVGTSRARKKDKTEDQHVHRRNKNSSQNELAPNERRLYIVPNVVLIVEKLNVICPVLKKSLRQGLYEPRARYEYYKQVMYMITTIETPQVRRSIINNGEEAQITGDDVRFLKIIKLLRNKELYVALVVSRLLNFNVDNVVVKPSVKNAYELTSRTTTTMVGWSPTTRIGGSANQLGVSKISKIEIRRTSLSRRSGTPSIIIERSSRLGLEYYNFDSITNDAAVFRTCNVIDTSGGLYRRIHVSRTVHKSRRCAPPISSYIGPAFGVRPFPVASYATLQTTKPP